MCFLALLSLFKIFFGGSQNIYVRSKFCFLFPKSFFESLYFENEFRNLFQILCIQKENFTFPAGFREFKIHPVVFKMFAFKTKLFV